MATKRKVDFYAKQWRKERDLSPEEAAKLAGMSPAHLLSLEGRRIQFTEADLQGLAKAYDVHESSLLGLNPLRELSYLQHKAAQEDAPSFPRRRKTR